MKWLALWCVIYTALFISGCKYHFVVQHWFTTILLLSWGRGGFLYCKWKPFITNPNPKVWMIDLLTNVSLHCLHFLISPVILWLQSGAEFLTVEISWFGWLSAEYQTTPFDNMLTESSRPQSYNMPLKWLQMFPWRYAALH